MSSNTLLSPAARIGAFKGEILAHAVPKEIIGVVCKSMKKMVPKNSSSVVKFRRWLPKGATISTPNTWSVDPAAHQLGDGETPQAESIVPQDINATLQQFGVLYRYTDQTADMYEDDVPAEMVKLTGERMGLLREMIRYGILKAGTNVFYSGTVSTRATVVARIDANMLRRIGRSLETNLASKMTGVLSGSSDVGTQPIEASYVVVHSSDMSPDIRAQLSGFVHSSDYGQKKLIHPDELGSWDQFRFVPSPHMAPYLLAGANATVNTVLANGAPCTGSNASDVYPFIVMAEEAYGDVMLRGMDSFQAFHRKPGGGDGSQSSSDDPLAQRGHVGAKFYMTAVRLNELHMAVGEAAVGALVL